MNISHLLNWNCDAADNYSSSKTTLVHFTATLLIGNMFLLKVHGASSQSFPLIGPIDNFLDGADFLRKIYLIDVLIVAD